MIDKIDWKDNKNVIIPQGTKLTERMFQYNNMVETITLPDDVVCLPEYFCFGCKNLQAIFGGHNIKIIRYNTFEGSIKLHHLEFIPQIGYQTYNRGALNECSIKVVRELKTCDFEDYYSKGKLQYGYVLHRQKNEYLFWNISEKKYVYAFVSEPLPLLSYVSFQCKCIIYYDTNNNLLDIERNLVDNVNVADDEDSERFTYTDDGREYINGSYSYIKKIKSMNETVLKYIKSLDIEKIIESYSISIEEYIHTKIGDDDTYTLTESANSDAAPSDVYLNKLLPTFSKTTKERGYCTFSYMSDNEKEKYKEKENSVKNNAKKYYSKEDHITSLMDAYIKYLYLKTKIYQEVSDAVNFLNNNRDYIRNTSSEHSDYSYYWNDISKFTFKLNKKISF